MCLLYEWESARRDHCSPWRERILLLACFCILHVFSRPFPERGGDHLKVREICRFLETKVSIRGLRESVAESDVYTDVALALEIAATGYTGSHQHMS